MSIGSSLPLILFKCTSLHTFIRNPFELSLLHICATKFSASGGHFFSGEIIRFIVVLGVDQTETRHAYPFQRTGWPTLIDALKKKEGLILRFSHLKEYTTKYNKESVCLSRLGLTLMCWPVHVNVGLIHVYFFVSLSCWETWRLCGTIIVECVSFCLRKMGEKIQLNAVWTCSVYLSHYTILILNKAQAPLKVDSYGIKCKVKVPSAQGS